MPVLDETPSDDAPRDRKSPTTSTGPARPEGRWARWRRPLFEALALLAVFVALRAFQSRSLVSGAAPSITTVAIDGEQVRLGSGAGRGQLLWFFATWCTVCRASEHNVRALADRREDIVLVASDSGSSAALAAWLRQQGLDRLRVVNDSDGAIARAFGVRSFPTTIAVSSRGEVRSTDVGYTTELGLRWRLFRARH